MPHPVLSAILTFGLVNVPIRLYTAAQSKRVSFHLLDSRSGQRVRQQLVSDFSPEEESDLQRRSMPLANPIDGQTARGNQPLHTTVKSEVHDDRALAPLSSESVVPRQDVVKGYEITPGQYVEISSDELKTLEAEANRHAEIQEFVPLSEVDPIYFDKTYRVGPEKGSEKVYRLLARAMRQQQRGAIAKLIMRGKEKLVFIRPTKQDRLLLEVLFYADEVRSIDELPIGEIALSDVEVQLAEQVIAGLTKDRWQPEQYHDTYRERVLALIEQKRQGEPIREPQTRQQPPVLDLMEALRRSLQKATPKVADRRPGTAHKKVRKAG